MVSDESTSLVYDESTSLVYDESTSCRLGKLACPRVNDDQKIHVDHPKLSSGRPHDYWILERLFYEILCFFL